MSSNLSTSSAPIRLWSNNAERDQHENYASLFAIFKATEALEKAYTRDIIPKAEYECLYYDY